MAIDVMSDEVGVWIMVASLNVSSEGIRRDQAATQIGSISEFKNGVPFAITFGELGGNLSCEVK